MHRKTTSRRENKRLVNKAERQAVTQALRGDHLRQPHTRYRQPILPLDTDPRPVKQKKHRKTIDYCPVRERNGEGKKRHYYIEKTETVEGRRYNWRTWEWGERFTYEYHYKLCMYCGKKGRASRKGGKHYY